MDKLTKDRAIFYNIVLPGWGDVYIEKNHSSISILVIGIITSLLGLYSFYDLCNYFGFFSLANALEPLFKFNLNLYLDKKANESFLDHYLFIGYTFVLPRILFTFMINDRWKKYHNKINNVTVENKKDVERFDFIIALTKLSELKESGIYSENDFSLRKNDAILNLLKVGTTEKAEDFLVKLIPLKDKGILTLEEVNEIKISLSEKIINIT